MPWHFPWSENIKKRACRYLLQRYLGQFLKEKLTLEQLNVDIYEGTGNIKDIVLDVEALNELGAANNLPVYFVDGFIGEVCVSVPWSAVLTSSSYVQISRLQLTVRAKAVENDAAMFDSMLDSMSASTLDLAKECLSQSPQGGATDTRADTSDTLEGIEALARAIDSVLVRARVTLVDSVVRWEHVTKGVEGFGVGLELRIDSAEYMDEAGHELVGQSTSAPRSSDNPHNPPQQSTVASAVACKRLTLRGVRFYGDRFIDTEARHSDSRVNSAMAASYLSQHQQQQHQQPQQQQQSMFQSAMAASDLSVDGAYVDDDEDDNKFYTACGTKSPVLADQQDAATTTTTALDSGDVTAGADDVNSEVRDATDVQENGAMLLCQICDNSTVRCEIKLDDSAPGPSIGIHVSTGSLRALLSPNQVHALTQLLTDFSEPPATENLQPAGAAVSCQKLMTPADYQLIEQQLMRNNQQQQQQHGGHPASHAISLGHGWSGQTATSIDEEDEFMSVYRSEIGAKIDQKWARQLDPTTLSPGAPPSSITCTVDTMESSTVSSVSASVFSESIRSDSTRQQRRYSRARRRREQIRYDASAGESLRLHVQAGSAVLVLLHDDVLLTDPVTDLPSTSSCNQMNEIVNTFMARLDRLEDGAAGGLHSMNSERRRDILLQACPRNHISFIAWPVKLDCGERPLRDCCLTTLRIDCGFAEILECLPVPDKSPTAPSNVTGTSYPSAVYTELLTFDAGSGRQFTSGAVSLDVRHSRPITGHVTSASLGHTAVSTIVRISLGSGASMEIDPSLMDRISTLLFASANQNAPMSETTPPSRLTNQSVSTVETPLPSRLTNQSPANDTQVCFDQTVNDTVESSSHLHLDIHADSLRIKLRIPVADLRPVTDPDRPSWRERCLRDDSLLATLTNFRCSAVWPPVSTSSLYHRSRSGASQHVPMDRGSNSCRGDSCCRLEVQCRRFQLFYCANDVVGNSQQQQQQFVQLLQSSADYDAATDPTDDLDWPRLVVTISPPISDTPCSALDPGGGSGAEEVSGESTPVDGLCGGGLEAPSPFATRRVVFNTETPVSSSPLSSDQHQENEGECLTVPAGREQMQQFVDTVCSRCAVLFELFLPSLQARIPDQSTYAALYNRLANDLALWEPCSPLASAYFDADYDISAAAMTTDLDMDDDTYRMCRSATLFADEDSGSETGSGVYSSAHGRRMWRRQRREQQLKRFRQSKVCFRVRTGRGTIVLNTPCVDENGVCMSGQQGELQLFYEGGMLLCVSGYDNQSGHGFVCVNADTIHLYHKNCVPRSSMSASMPPLNSTAPYMNKIISPSSMPGRNSTGSDTPMLSVSLKYQLDIVDNVKTFTVAVGLDSCLGRYLPLANHRQLFVCQLIDMFDVADEAVPGYNVPVTVTELHVQLTRSSVEYCPVKLPYCYLLSCDNVTVSSHLVVGVTPSSPLVGPTSVSVLRVILEETGLHVASVALSADNSSDTSATFNSSNSDEDNGALYVCVLDAGFLELSVCTREGGVDSLNIVDAAAVAAAPRPGAAPGGREVPPAGKVGAPGRPAVEWRINNDRVRVRTCSDTLRALLRLVSHLTATGGVGGEVCDAPSTNSGASCLSSPATPETRCVLPAREGAGDSIAGETDGSREEHPDRPLGLEGMIEDAMLDTSPPAKTESAGGNSAPVEIFFFPNETGGGARDLSRDSRSLHTAAAPDSPSLVGAGPSGFSIDDRSMVAASNYDDDEEFCVLEDDLGVGIRSRSGEPQVRRLVVSGSEPVRLIEGHFETPSASRVDVLRAPVHFPTPLFRFTLQHLTLSWCMFGGCDLSPSPMDDATSSPQISKPRRLQVRISSSGSPRLSLTGPSVHMIRTPQEDNSACVVFSKHGLQQVPSALQFGVLTAAVDTEAEGRSRQSGRQQRERGGPHRVNDKLMELKLTKVRCQFDRYPAHCEQAARVVATVADVEMLDRIATSDINKFLYQYSSDGDILQVHSNVLLAKALIRRPDPSVNAEECDVRVSARPIRLNIDQEALFFLRDFFTLAMIDADGSVEDVSADSSPNTTNTTVLSDLDTDSDDYRPPTPGPFTAVSVNAARDVQPIFFRAFTFSPELVVRIDYRGRRVDIGQLGPVMGLLVGLGQLNCCQIKLKRIYHRRGVLGVERLVSHVLNEWLTDIRRNQLPSLLGGIGPMHCFIQLFQGVRDLLWLPFEQYRKDGRIVKGLQRGANSFSTSTAVALIELTSRLVHCIQSASELAYDLLSPGPTVQQQRTRRRHRRHRQLPASQLPIDLREGVANAYHLVKEGLGDTATLLARVAATEHDSRGISGAVGGVLRQIPPTAVTPLLLASEATSNVLGGIRHQLLPGARREALDKWKSPD